MFCLFPKGRTEGVTARLSGFWKSPEEDNYSCGIHANYNQATVAFKMSISWSLHDKSSQGNCLVFGDWSHAEILEFVVKYKKFIQMCFQKDLHMQMSSERLKTSIKIIKTRL